MNRLLSCALLLPAVVLAETPAETKTRADFDVKFSGYVRAGYESVQDDPDITFVGRNDGFLLQNARLNMDAADGKWGVSARIGIEGAADKGSRLNTPESALGLSLRDAYVRWDICGLERFVGVQVGQFKAPFAAEELESTRDQMFAYDSVGFEGVLVGHGYQLHGMAVDRQIGAMLSPKEHIRFGSFGVGYYLMAASGNGANQALDDNGKPAFYGRLELSWDDMVVLGAAALLNSRADIDDGDDGETPDLNEEDDFGIAADLRVRFAGLHVFAQFAQIETEPKTIAANPTRKAQALSAQLGYAIDLGMWLTPAYRFATYDPYVDGGGSGAADLDTAGLQYHTVGLKLENPERWLSLIIDYTLTMEDEARALDNDWLNVIAQVAF